MSTLMAPVLTLVLALSSLQPASQTLPDLTGTWVLVDAETLDRGPLLSQPGDRNPTYGARSVPAFGTEFTVTREHNILRVRQALPQVTVDRDFDVTGKPTAGTELAVKTVNTMAVNGSAITLVVSTEVAGNASASNVTRTLTLEADGTLTCVTSGVNGRGPMNSRYRRK